MMDTYKKDLTITEFTAVAIEENTELAFWTDQIESLTVGEDVLADLVQRVVQKDWAHNHALVSIDVAEGRRPIEAISTHFDSLIEKPTEEIEYVTDDLEELVNETIATRGLRWRLASLNQSLGSLRKGDFGFVFARPETGKTTFLASEVTHFAKQAESPILWFNNEEQGNKVKIRCYQATLGLKSRELLKVNKPKAIAKYKKLTNGNLRMIDAGALHKRFIERICKEVNPSLVIFDQIDKLKGFTNDREDLRLGAIYIWARDLAKKYCPVIGICQADVSGEGKKWLTMDNVANAKTSKQAEADWILGIGCTHNMGLDHLRYLHLSKNKLMGDEDTAPEKRHAKIECIIDAQIARYKDF
jgi:replicative DNA helicase